MICQHTCHVGSPSPPFTPAASCARNSSSLAEFHEDDRKASARIVRKLQSLNLVTETPTSSLGLLARVTNKAIYRLLGADNIRYRRLPSLPLIYRRLLSLDYVLAHPDLLWLPTESEKVSCFTGLGISHSDLPRRTWDNATGQTVRYFANKHPIAVDARNKQTHFVYTDSDEKSPHGVRSWRTEHTPLWTALQRLGFNLHIVHASFNPRLNSSVSRVFSSWKNRPQSSIPLSKVENELARVENAIHSRDESELHHYGGFNNALRASVALKQRLVNHADFQPFSASYQTWLSDRIIQARDCNNSLGSRTLSS